MRYRTNVPRRHRRAVAACLLFPMMTGWASPSAAAEHDDPAPGEAQPINPEGWMIERFEWATPAGAVARVLISNPHGDIRARSAKHGKLELLGLLQFHRSETDRPTVEVRQDGDTVEVRVDMPQAPGGDAKRRVDISVLVPPGVGLQAATRRGLIRAKNLKSDIEAATGDGEIGVSTSGSIQLSSRHGNVSAMLTSEHWASRPTISTQTGEIEILLSDSASVAIEASTSGHITTDFSVDIDYDRHHDRKRARALLAGGRQNIELRSARGNIKILRSPLEPQETANPSR